MSREIPSPWITEAAMAMGSTSHTSHATTTVTTNPTAIPSRAGHRKPTMSTPIVRIGRKASRLRTARFSTVRLPGATGSGLLPLGSQAGHHGRVSADSVGATDGHTPPTVLTMLPKVPRPDRPHRIEVTGPYQVGDRGPARRAGHTSPAMALPARSAQRAGMSAWVI